MKRTQEEILAAIRDFQPADGNWLGLEALFEELWQYPVSTAWVLPLLSVFERFPDEDGDGVFWSIVHGLEAIPCYEPILRESHRRHPCEFKGIMLQRIKNAEEENDQS